MNDENISVHACFETTTTKELDLLDLLSMTVKLLKIAHVVLIIMITRTECKIIDYKLSFYLYIIQI